MQLDVGGCGLRTTTRTQRAQGRVIEVYWMVLDMAGSHPSEHRKRHTIRRRVTRQPGRSVPRRRTVPGRLGRRRNCEWPDPRPAPDTPRHCRIPPRTPCTPIFHGQPPETSNVSPKACHAWGEARALGQRADDNTAPGLPANWRPKATKCGGGCLRPSRAAPRRRRSRDTPARPSVERSARPARPAPM